MNFKNPQKDLTLFWKTYIDNYQEELKQQIQKRQQRDIEAVEFVTFHGSKGLEYKIVWIVDANEEITPHSKAILLEDLEEERRMFYVAMTRAKDKLHIYSVKERYGKKLSCSRFVGELYLSVQDLQQGTKVYHKKYGKGVILENLNAVALSLISNFLSTTAPKEMFQNRHHF